MEIAVTSHDQALIDECLGGRVNAFGDLIAPYRDRLYNALYRILGSREDAAEVWQETMIRAFRGLESFHGHASFYTWLYRIAMNEALSSQRRRRLPTMAGDQLRGERMNAWPARGDDTPSRNLEQQERQQWLEKAIAKLDNDHRVVLVLKEVEGLKYDEIADILRIPLGTVRSRLHRARCELRERLRPMLEKGLI